MVVCSFFLKGNCRFGERCRNEHTQQNPGFGGSSGGLFGNANAKNDRFHFSKNNNSAFGASSTNLSNEEKSFLKLVRTDLVDWDRNKVWPLSCFAAQKEKPCLPGLVEMSPEELRLEAYKHKDTSLQPYLEGLQTLTQKQMTRRQQLKSLNEQQLLKEIKSAATASQTTGRQTSGLFGAAPSAPSLFGAAQQPSTGLFASNTQSKGLFAQNSSAAGNPFASAAAKPSGGLFAQPSNSGGLFGNNNQSNNGGLFSLNKSGGPFSSNNNTSGGGLFSSNKPGGLFSNNPTNDNNSGGLFSSNNATSSGGGLLSSNTNKSGGLFSSNTNQSGGLFASSNNNTSGGLFSNNTATSSASGGLLSQNSNSGGLFSSNSVVKPGGLFAPSSSAAPSGGLFASSSIAAASSGGLLSSTTQNAGNPFANQGTGVSGGIFGQPPAQPPAAPANPFLALTQTKPQQLPIYEQLRTWQPQTVTEISTLPPVTAEDVEIFKAAKFELNNIPTCPPPIELCG